MNEGMNEGKQSINLLWRVWGPNSLLSSSHRPSWWWLRPHSITIVRILYSTIMLLWRDASSTKQRTTSQFDATTNRPNSFMSSEVLAAANVSGRLPVELALMSGRTLQISIQELVIVREPTSLSQVEYWKHNKRWHHRQPTKKMLATWFLALKKRPVQLQRHGKASKRCWRKRGRASLLSMTSSFKGSLMSDVRY
jgi:hypothetical protein